MFSRRNTKVFSWRNTKKVYLNTTIILNFEPSKQLLYCHVHEIDLDWHVLQPYKVFHRIYSDIHCGQLFVLLKTKHSEIPWDRDFKQGYDQRTVLQ